MHVKIDVLFKWIRSHCNRVAFIQLNHSSAVSMRFSVVHFSPDIFPIIFSVSTGTNMCLHTSYQWLQPFLWFFRLAICCCGLYFPSCGSGWMLFALFFERFRYAVEHLLISPHKTLEHYQLETKVFTLQSD